MAVALISNMMKNSVVTEDENGLTVKESILVNELTPTSRSPLWDALNAVDMPEYASEHPYIPGVFVRSRIPRGYLNSRTQAIVDITWKPTASAIGGGTPTDPAGVQFTAFLREMQTSKDRNGAVIRVRYKPTKPGGGLGAEKSRIARVTDFKAMGTLAFDFVKSADPSSMLGYYGRWNSAPWRGGAKYTWHFAGLTIQKQQYNPWWNVHAEFIYDPETHVRTAFFTDKDGNIPFDVETPVDPYNTANLPGTHGGWKNALTQQEADFNALSLPTGF